MISCYLPAMTHFPNVMAFIIQQLPINVMQQFIIYIIAVFWHCCVGNKGRVFVQACGKRPRRVNFDAFILNSKNKEAIL